MPSYLASLSNCERTWIKKYAERPTRKFVAPWEPPVHLQVPEDHVRMLDMYDHIAGQFIPPDERSLRPTLTLRDSNMGNIFLSRTSLERDGTIISQR